MHDNRQCGILGLHLRSALLNTRDAVCANYARISCRICVPRLSAVFSDLVAHPQVAAPFPPPSLLSLVASPSCPSPPHNQSRVPCWLQSGKKLGLFLSNPIVTKRQVSTLCLKKTSPFLFCYNLIRCHPILSVLEEIYCRKFGTNTNAQRTTSHFVRLYCTV